MMNGALTVPEVAKKLNVTEEHVRRLLRRHKKGLNGGLEGFKVGWDWRIAPEKLDAFIATGGTQGGKG